MPGRSDERATLLRLLTGHIRTQCAFVIAKLGVVDEIPRAGRAHVDDIARAVGADADALHRVLRALAAEGLFAEVAPRVFAVTELGELMRDGEQSFRYSALYHGGMMADLFLDLYDSVRTGTPVPVLRHGRTHWELFAESPEDAELFNRTMRVRAHALADVARSLTWDGVRTVVDVGGGIGGVLFPLLAAEPHLHGVLFDLPHVESEAHAAIDAAGLQERCAFEPGSFFDAIPADADAYLLSNVLHDWDDSHAMQILATCRRAARSDSRLVVLESLLPAGDDPHPVKTLDLHMLVALGGRERTADEYARLLSDAGFGPAAITGEAPAALVAYPV